MAIGHRIRKKLGNWRKLKRQKLENNVNVKKQPLEVFYKKSVYKNFATFTGKHKCRSLFLIKLFQRRCFLVNISKYLGTSVLKNVCKQLLLNFVFYSNEEQHLLAELDEMGDDIHAVFI